MSKKKWNILHAIDNDPPAAGLTIDKIIQIILENRGITTQEEKEKFLHPKLEEVTIENVGIDTEQVEKAVSRIKKAIETQEHIVVFGDYDVDGITGTAILWETLYDLKANVTPYIPDRVEEGYGLSIAGLENLLNQEKKPELIITVDNGIVANQAVTFANGHGIEVIITDHHARGDVNPDAYAIVHTTKLCGAGVGLLLSKELKNPLLRGWVEDTHLDLVTLATIADLVPLTEANRTLVKIGLKALRKTTRAGLLELCNEAGIEVGSIGVYEIGHIIGPRLNAMGRMASAMDSLRLLCTKDRMRAKALAEKLGRTNKERQMVTQQMTEHALEGIRNQESAIKNLLFVYHEEYEQGVIGLVASKLVETYYRPAIVLSKGETHSKASARSISGFNIIEFIRSSSHLLVNAGGHPMAAGFTVETEKLEQLRELMEHMAAEQITEDLLIRTIKIDCELPLEIINKKLYETIQTLSPFGMANPEPIFSSKQVIVEQVRAIGAEGKHLKLKVKSNNRYSDLSPRHPELSSRHSELVSESLFDAIAFNMGEFAEHISVGNAIDIVYTIDENEWRGEKNLQLKVKDIQC